MVSKSIHPSQEQKGQAGTLSLARPFFVCQDSPRVGTTWISRGLFGGMAIVIPAKKGDGQRFVTEYRHYRTGKLMRVSDYGYKAWPFAPAKKKPA